MICIIVLDRDVSSTTISVDNHGALTDEVDSSSIVTKNLCALDFNRSMRIRIRISRHREL